MAAAQTWGLGALALAIVVILLPAAVEATVIYTAGCCGFGGQQGNTPQEFESSQGWNSTDLRQRYYYSRSEASGLHAILGVQGTSVDNFFTAIEVDDVIFSSTIPGSTEELITFGGDLTGQFMGIGGGTAIVDVFISVPGAGRAVNRVAFDTNDGSSVSVPVEVSTVVPLGVPVRVGATLELRGNALFGQRLLLDFANSFDFDVSSVFGISNGVTASSASWGLVDNRLDGGSQAVPTPATLPLLGTGLVGAVCANRRRRSR